MIYHDPLSYDDLFYAIASSSTLPSESSHTPQWSVWDLNDPLHLLADTPEFYQRLLGPLPHLDETSGMTMAHQLEMETLLLVVMDPTTKINIPVAMAGCWLPMSKHFSSRGQDQTMVAPYRCLLIALN
jgi:hypothetical protein